MGRYAHVGGPGRLTEQDDRRAVDDALRAVELDALRGRPLSHLSGGERRRALIASVLAQEPDILLLDEPTASLDIHHAAAVMRLLSGLGPDGRGRGDRDARHQPGRAVRATGCSCWWTAASRRGRRPGARWCAPT